MKNEINNITINNSTNIKNVINPKQNFKENTYFILPDISLADVLAFEDIEKVLKDREMFETLIKNNKFESSNLKEYLSLIEKDFYEINKNEENLKGECEANLDHINAITNQNLEYIQFKEKTKDQEAQNINKECNSFSFKDDLFFHSLLAEVKILPFNRMTLINLLLNYAINFLNKANKTPMAKGLEWVLKEIRENFSYQIDKSTVEYFEKIKDANQQIKTVYEWVKEYSSYNDNQKNIYEFEKTKNLDSLKNKKPFNTNYSANASMKYKKFKRLVTFSNPKSSGGMFSKGIAPFSTFSTTSAFEEDENLYGFASNNDLGVTIKRNSYSINKGNADFIVVRSSVGGINNLNKNNNVHNTKNKNSSALRNSKEKSFDFITVKRQGKNKKASNCSKKKNKNDSNKNTYMNDTLEYMDEKNSDLLIDLKLNEKSNNQFENKNNNKNNNNYKNNNNNDNSSLEKKEESLINEQVISISKNKFYKNFSRNKATEQHKKNLAVKNKAEFNIISKTPEKKNSSIEDDNSKIARNTDKTNCRFPFNTGKNTSSVISAYINKKIMQKHNSSKKHSSINVNNSAILNLNNLSVSISKKSRNEDFSNISSISKSPILITRNINKNNINDFSYLNANATITANVDLNNQTLNQNTKLKTPIKTVSKLTHKSKLLSSSNVGYISRLENSSKNSKTINKFNTSFYNNNNISNKTINDFNNLNKNLLLNSTAKDKKTFNELILSRFTKSPNYAYKYNGVLKYHNNTNSNTNNNNKSVFVKNKNEIKNERRKSKSFNEREFRALGICGKSQILELEEIKTDDEIFLDLAIKDETILDKCLTKINESNSDYNNQNRKNSDSQTNEKPDKNKEAFTFLKQANSHAAAEAAEISSNITSKNNSIIHNNINESEKMKNSDISFISEKSVLENKDPLTIRNNLSLKVQKQKQKQKQNQIHKAKSNKIDEAAKAADSSASGRKKVIVFEKIQEDEKDLLIFTSRRSRRFDSSLFALNHDNEHYDETTIPLKVFKSTEKDSARKIRGRSAKKFCLLEKVYKVVEKQSFIEFNKSEKAEETKQEVIDKPDGKNNENNNDNDNNEIERNDIYKKNSNENYLTFNSNKNIKEKNENSINESVNKKVSQILNVEESVILSKICAKKVSNVMKNFEQKLNKIQSAQFDIFDLRNFVGAENILPVISAYIFSVTDYFSFLNKKHFENFIYEISRGYVRENHYHNDLHGADVTQSSFIYMTKANLKESLVLTDIDCAGFLLASIIHDFKHPGVTNGFLINSKDLISLTYNDNSVLENYHVAEAFKIISLQKNCNIFSDLSKEDFKIIRKRIIELVLATDMTMHAKELAFIKSKLESLILLQNQNQNQNQTNTNNNNSTEKDAKNQIAATGDITNIINNDKQKDKAFLIKNLLENSNSTNLFTLQQEFLNIIIHMADISNPTKPTEIYMKWTDLVMNEFWLQGDKEKSLGLPISFLCDRVGASVPKAQIGFMDGIVMPLLICVVEIFPDLKFLKENIEKNKVVYKELLEKEEAQKQAQLAQLKN